MKFFKKIFKIYKAYKSTKLGFVILDLIEEKKYEIALVKINAFRDKYSKTDKILDLNLLEYQLHFILKNYSKLLIKEKLIEIIDGMKNHSLDLKRYQKLFIYNISYLSYQFLDNIEKANEMKINFHEINYDLNMNNVKEYLQNRYPIYNGKLLENLFKEDGYYDIYPREKLEYI
ncbi:MAG: hypothetical protein HRT40_12470, partial [Campylobacteraceae bacterium]|nr:hypothetical protein [Campylobacteraceae bacterium]